MVDSRVRAEDAAEPQERGCCAFALEALKRHYERQQEAKRQAGAAWQKHEYIFCTSIGTHLHPSKDVLDQLKALLKKVGLPAIRFHGLCHSVATPLLSEGVHPKVFQELLGHSNISRALDVVANEHSLVFTEVLFVFVKGELCS